MFIILINCQLRIVGTQIKDDLICNIIRFPFNQENGKWKIISPVDLCQVHISTTTSFFWNDWCDWAAVLYVYNIQTYISIYIHPGEQIYLFSCPWCWGLEVYNPICKFVQWTVLKVKICKSNILPWWKRK